MHVSRKEYSLSRFSTIIKHLPANCEATSQEFRVVALCVSNILADIRAYCALCKNTKTALEIASACR